MAGKLKVSFGEDSKLIAWKNKAIDLASVD